MNIFHAMGPCLLGYLILTEQGAVLASYGELENDEKISEIIFNLIQISFDPAVFPKNSLQKITIAYENFCYIVCMSNRKFYIGKKKL